MFTNLIPSIENLLVIFAFIGGVYAGYKVLKSPLMNWIQKKIGVDELQKAHANISNHLTRQDEKLDSIMIQLTLNGGSMTIKDDVSSIKNTVNIIQSELRATVALSSTPTFINDKTGSCIMVNDALCELFGATKDEMLGFGWVNFLLDEEKQVKADNWKRGILKDTYIKDSYHVIHGKTGERMCCEYTATVTRDRNGEVISIMGTVKRTDKK